MSNKCTFVKFMSTWLNKWVTRTQFQRRVGGVFSGTVSDYWLGVWSLGIQGPGVSHIWASRQVLFGHSFINPQASYKWWGRSLWRRGHSVWLTDTNLSPLLRAHLRLITQPLSFMAFVTVCTSVVLCFFVSCLAIVQGRTRPVARAWVQLVPPGSPTSCHTAWHSGQLRAVWSPHSASERIITNS